MSEGFDVTLSAARSALAAGQENVVEVLIRVQAPDAPKSGLPERQPLNLAIVIDRSGSMAGEPLLQAKRCAAFMIDSLKATDRACVVAYDDRVEVFAASRPVADKDHFKASIAHIRDGGSTNLHGGWLKGAEEAAGHLDPATISRVLLLSDGNANAGHHGDPNPVALPFLAATNCTFLDAFHGVSRKSGLSQLQDVSAWCR